MKSRKILFFVIPAGVFLLFAVFYSYLYNLYKPINVKITNISSNSFTVIWATKRRSRSKILYDSLENRKKLFKQFNYAYDVRDYNKAELEALEKSTQDNIKFANLKVNKLGRYNVHYVNVNNLKEDAQYYFKISNGPFVYRERAKVDTYYSNIPEFNITAYVVGTLKHLENQSLPNPSFGSITKNGKPLEDAYVISYLINKNSQKDNYLNLPLSSLVKEGTFYLDLGNSFTAIDSKPMNIGDDPALLQVIEIYSKNGLEHTEEVELSENAPTKQINILTKSLGDKLSFLDRTKVYARYPTNIPTSITKRVATPTPTPTVPPQITSVPTPALQQPPAATTTPSPAPIVAVSPSINPKPMERPKGCGADGTGCIGGADGNTCRPHGTVGAKSYGDGSCYICMKGEWKRTGTESCGSRTDKSSSPPSCDEGKYVYKYTKPGPEYICGVAKEFTDNSGNRHNYWCCSLSDEAICKRENNEYNTESECLNNKSNTQTCVQIPKRFAICYMRKNISDTSSNTVPSVSTPPESITIAPSSSGHSAGGNSSDQKKASPSVTQKVTCPKNQVKCPLIRFLKSASQTWCEPQCEDKGVKKGTIKSGPKEDCGCNSERCVDNFVLYDSECVRIGEEIDGQRFDYCPANLPTFSRSENIANSKLCHDKKGNTTKRTCIDKYEKVPDGPCVSPDRFVTYGEYIREGYDCKNTLGCRCKIWVRKNLWIPNDTKCENNNSSAIPIACYELDGLDKCYKAIDTPLESTRNDTEAFRNIIRDASANMNDNTFLVSDNGLLKLDSKSVINVVYKGKTYTATIPPKDASRLFLDDNKNGKKDANEKYLDEVTDIKAVEFEIVQKNYSYEFKPGYNYVAFPFLFKDGNLKKADALLRSLRKKANFTLISRYNGNWQTIDQFMVGNGQPSHSEIGDFAIVPGKGYVIRLLEDNPVYIELEGYPLKSKLPITLTRGWNLLGFYSNTRTYTAGSMLDQVNSAKSVDSRPVGITAVNLTKWEFGRFDGIQKENNKVYGFDYPLTWDKAYFMNVKSIEKKDSSTVTIEID